MVRVFHDLLSLQEPKPVMPKPDTSKLQAKVKPMSTSDEKMMEEAIHMAQEIASHNNRAEMVGDDVFAADSDKDSGSDSPRLFSKLKASMRKSPKQERKRTFSDSLNREIQDDVPPEAQEAYNMLVVHGSVKEGSRGFTHRQTEDKRESLISNGSSGQNFAYADSSSSASMNRTPDRASPIKSISRQSSEHGSASPPIVPRVPHKGTPVVSAPERPTPIARDSPPTLPKRGSIPVPRLQRVEPTPRPAPPPVPFKEFERTESASNNAFENPLVINEDSWKKSEESLKSDRNSQNLSDDKMDSLNTSIDSGRKSTSPSDASQSSASKFSFFEEEFEQPSPREIMNKLARESRLRRSLDHQRGGEGDAPPNRNLREPAGIPGKSPLPPANGGDEEVDTNPLRMLRGGVIPVRGGRAGSGMSSNKPTLRHPKLHFSTGGTPLQHSISTDSGVERTPSQSNDEPQSPSQAPALPPRSLSICDSHVFSNPLPLPPRTTRRTVSLNLKPRERKYPLMLGNTNNANTSSPEHQRTNVYNNASASQSLTSHEMPVACETRVSDLVFEEIISANEKYSKPFPLPDSIQEINSSSLLNLPQAPPPPSYQVAVAMGTDDMYDDNVFEPSTSSNTYCVKNVNLSSEGGSSGASTFPRGFKLFGIKNIKCNLEQLGFYNQLDPFWVNSVLICAHRKYSDGSEATESDASPLMLANYKYTEGVSYEDLLDFALDR